MKTIKSMCMPTFPLKSPEHTTNSSALCISYSFFNNKICFYSKILPPQNILTNQFYHIIFNKQHISHHSAFLLPSPDPDGSEVNTAGHVISPRSIMVHHGFRSEDVRCTRKQNIDHPKQQHTTHCWLPAQVTYPATSTKSFSWLTHSTPLFIVGQHSYIYMYVDGSTLVRIFLFRAMSSLENLTVLKINRAFCLL